MYKNTRRLVESAVLIAIGTVLSLPFLMPANLWVAGGSVTVGSMLPIVVLAHRHGLKWGVFSALVYSLLQLLLGLNNLKYAGSAAAVAGIIALDYVLAYGALGLAAIFNRRFTNRLTSILAGIVFTYGLRFLCHFLSGWLLFASYAPEGTPAWLYSLTYNGSYMLPETLVALTIAAVSYPPLKRFWLGQDLSA